MKTLKSYKNKWENLTMDVYEPKNDTAPARPVLVYFHGGSFITGSKSDADAVYFCQEYAKTGREF